MNPLLVILNPRDIPECVDSFRALDVPKAWMTGYRERQLIEPLADLVAATDYSHYILVSDDVIVSPEAWTEVVSLLELGHPVATGWCNLDETHHLVNLTKSPLKPTPTVDAYDFYRWMEVLAHPGPVVPTSFAGMCLTGMSRELWQRFPFGCYGDPGAGSDFHLCIRLQVAEVPIVAAKGAFAYHVKQEWNVPDADPRKALVHVNGQAHVTLEDNTVRVAA